MAKPVLKVREDRDEKSRPMEAVYWLSATMLLIITTEQEGETDGTAWRGHAELFDTATKQRSRLTALDPILNAPDRPIQLVPLDFQLSTEGSWLYFRYFRHNANLEFTPIVVNLKSGRVREWKVAESISAFWADDNRYAEVNTVERDNDRGGTDIVPHISIHDARGSRGDRTIDPVSTEAVNILQPFEQGVPIHPTLDAWDTGYGWTQSWFQLRNGTLVNTSSRFYLPVGAASVDRNDIPTSQFPVFHLHWYRDLPLLASVHRFLPFVRSPQICEEGLWVESSNGEMLCELGHVASEESWFAAKDTELNQVQRVPGSNAISFTYKGMVYVLPNSAR